MEQTTNVAGEPSRNRSNGEVTVILLLIALPLLALLVFQQGRVIDTQRLLIRQLNSDSQQLNSMRVHELHDRSSKAQQPAATPQAEAPQQQHTEQQPSAAPERKNSKRHESKPVSPPPPQEYPATRPLPIRKSV